MKYTTTMIAPFALAALLGSGAALAADMEEGMETTVDWQSMDVNQDGYLSQDEIGDNEQLLGEWDTLDTNDDDMLEESEFAEFEIERGGFLDPDETEIEIEEPGLFGDETEIEMDDGQIEVDD